MGRASKRKTIVRAGGEFDIARLTSRLYAPSSSPGVFCWDLPAIRGARDEQLAGQFYRPAQLAAAMRTDFALFTASRNRLAPLRCIGVDVAPANTSSDAKRIAREGAALFGASGIGVRPETLLDVAGDIADHGVAFGCITANARPDGSRVDFDLSYWPIQWAYWDAYQRTFMARVHQGQAVPITHGDGRWVVFAKSEFEPFRREACVLPGALVWASHAFANRDWASGSTAHGNVKIIGKLPSGIDIQKEDGSLTNEAAALLELLKAMANPGIPVGIAPAGAEVELMANSSTAWQVWSELSTMGEKAAARIYQGTDALMGSAGGAPGVDISALFGVATTIVQGDLDCITRALQTGYIEPWCAVNFGSSALAPSRRYLMPDADADKERESYARRSAALHDEVKRLRENGFDVNVEVVAALAKRYDVDAPTLPVQASRAPTVTLAPTDVAKVVLVNEARASAGLGPLMLPGGGADPDGNITVSEFDKKRTAPAAAAPGAPGAPLQPGAAVAPPATP